MCVQFQIKSKGSVKFQNIEIPVLEFTKVDETEIWPGIKSPVIKNLEVGKPQKEIHPMIWGLLPANVSSEKEAFQISRKYSMHNARSETIDEKISYKHLFSNPMHRGLVPAASFFERHRGSKRNYRISRKDGDNFLIAALWNYWPRLVDYRYMSFTMVTTSPNELLKPIHHRMPVIINPDYVEPWLSNDINLRDLKRVITTPWNPDEYVAEAQ